MPLGVVEVADLEGAGDVLVGKVPGPRGALAEHDAALGLVEAAPWCLTLDTRGAHRGGLVRVTRGRALDGGRVGDRPRVAYGRAFVVAAFGAPDRDQLDLSGVGRAVGLLAVAADELRLAQRHAGPSHAQVQRRRRRLVGRRWLDRVDVVLTASGLESFEREYTGAREYELDGVRVKVLPLERVIVSKRAAKRPKDLAQIPMLEAVLAARKARTAGKE